MSSTPIDFDSAFTLTAIPELAAEWDESANGVPASAVDVFADQSATWRCTAFATHPRWTMTPREATASADGAARCPACRNAGRTMRSLSVTRPDLAQLLHPESGSPDSVSVAGVDEVLWLCENDPDHPPYRLAPRARANVVSNPCPSCYGPTVRWTEERLLAFVRDLDPTSGELNAAQMFAICQQNGLLSTRRGAQVADAVVTGDLTSLGDLLRNDHTDHTDHTGHDDAPDGVPPVGHHGVTDTDDTFAPAADGDHATVPAHDTDPAPVPAGTGDTGAGSLPGATTQRLLERLGVLVANCDEETADYLAASAVRALWDKAYELDRLERLDHGPDETAQVEALRADLAVEPPENAFAQTIWERFTDEYTEARTLTLPADWAFTPTPGAPVTAPNLMQKHVATVVSDRRRYGNWSGTGAGKTVSAVLAARLVGAGQDGIVLVVCPNNVVPVWASVVANCFRDARVATKTFTPDFGPGTGDRWLIVNYDMLPGRAGAVSRLVEDHGVDMLIIDEVHYVKHRADHDMSQRRQVLRGLAASAHALKPDLAVLAMSATPVVNDLHEARSLLELVEGENLDDVGVSATVNDAMSIHQRIVRSGTRWMPSYAAQLDVVTPRLDIGHLAEDLRALGRAASPLAVEQILVDAKTDIIIEHCLATRGRGKRSLVYTQFVDGIVDPLTDRLRAAGLTVGMFTGEDKDGLARLVGLTPAGEAVTDADRVDVLIGSDAVGTGVDGLQHVCDTLIFATLPWTHANYMQVVGRVHRQGQQADRVTVVIPSTHIDITTRDGVETWSWDDKAWGRIQNKRTLADCAVDGVVPDREMVTPTQAVRAHLRWLARLMEGNYRTTQRAPLDDGLGDDVDQLTTPARSARYGDLSRMNGVWGNTHSSVVHRRLSDDPAEWHRYHALYRAARLTWDVVPALLFAEWLTHRAAGQRVADLGCGEMLLADAAGERHHFDGYDHVGVDDRVTVCDIAAVPAADGSYDYAVLSLALMGANHVDYLREAHRILRTDGYLWLAEPTSHLGTDEAALRDRIAAFGFDVTTVETHGQFTLVRATKGDRSPTTDQAARVKETRDNLRALGVPLRPEHNPSRDTRRGGDPGDHVQDGGAP